MYDTEYQIKGDLAKKSLPLISGKKQMLKHAYLVHTFLTGVFSHQQEAQSCLLPTTAPEHNEKQSSITMKNLRKKIQFYQKKSKLIAIYQPDLWCA